MSKAIPVNFIYGVGYEACEVDSATRLMLNIPGPTGILFLPVITRGSRKDRHCWSWNGSVNEPTLKPSVLTEGHDFRCHSWINDGNAIFLSDSSHELSGQTVALKEVSEALL